MITFLFYIIFTYIAWEVIFFCESRLFIIQKIIIYREVRKWVKSVLPNNWTYKIGFITINKDTCFVKLIYLNDEKKDFYLHWWSPYDGENAYTFASVDIKDNSPFGCQCDYLISRMKDIDPLYTNELLKDKRDKKLQQLL